MTSKDPVKVVLDLLAMSRLREFELNVKLSNLRLEYGLKMLELERVCRCGEVRSSLVRKALEG